MSEATKLVIATLVALSAAAVTLDIYFVFSFDVSSARSAPAPSIGEPHNHPLTVTPRSSRRLRWILPSVDRSTCVYCRSPTRESRSRPCVS